MYDRKHSIVICILRGGLGPGPPHAHTDCTDPRCANRIFTDTRSCSPWLVPSDVRPPRATPCSVLALARGVCACASAAAFLHERSLITRTHKHAWHGTMQTETTPKHTQTNTHTRASDARPRRRPPATLSWLVWVHPRQSRGRPLATECRRGVHRRRRHAPYEAHTHTQDAHALCERLRDHTSLPIESPAPTPPPPLHSRRRHRAPRAVSLSLSLRIGSQDTSYDERRVNAARNTHYTKSPFPRGSAPPASGEQKPVATPPKARGWWATCGPHGGPPARRVRARVVAALLRPHVRHRPA